MKNFNTNFIVFLLISLPSMEIYSQEIRIDSTFRSSIEIFPFENIEQISDLTIEGDVELNHDTSLVRVILEDENGFQYMIFEAYSLICPNSCFTFNGYCDETCFLEQLNPYSIIIQVIDAELLLKSFSYSTEPKENPSEQRYEAKRAMDADKIAMMNQLIPSYEMNWTAGNNSIVASYFEQKRNLFGDGYNLLGYDYYAGGVFEFLGHRNYPEVDPDLVRQFDWRNRHGANDPQSPYWDGDTLGTGWLTSVKDQIWLGTCWAFSAAGLIEVMANLYANDHLDFDLSEQDLISCSGSGSCTGGNAVEALFSFVKNTGIVEELCFPYDHLDCPGVYYDSCDNKCLQPVTTIKINDTISVFDNDHDSVRLALIKHGPLTIGFKYSQGNTEGIHAVNLIGYDFDVTDSTSIWIIKNSWGVDDDWGINGFCTLKISSFKEGHNAGIETPIKLNGPALSVNCWDKDGDSLYFWGIGAKPENCNCSDIEDCDDNDPFVGGYDENYYCSCIFEMDSVTHRITSDTNWVDSTYVNYDVIIDSGACLTISSYAAFAPQAMIVVLHGAELIIDGGHLTKACPDLWGGIEVWGSDTSQYFDEYFGKVVIKNNAIIEFAKIGIANHCNRCANILMQSGGIILADSSVFRDNETDVLLAPFKNLWLGNEVPYVARFERCQFLTTDNFYPDFIPKSHVEMKDVYGIMFYGCVFKNESDLSLAAYPFRGKGISAIDAQFMLNKYCNTPNIIPCIDVVPCEFLDLEYGIKALNCRTERTLSIKEVNFNSDLIGISLSGIDYASVLSNDFKCLTDNLGENNDTFIGGLFMEGCSGYHVEDNFFHADTGSWGTCSPVYGIGVKNSGPEDNEIYNNRFYRLKTGIISLGENRGRESGLCLKCNDMSQNTNDFLVVEEDNPPLGVYQGINLYQGNPKDSLSNNAPAGNTFTFFSSPAIVNDVKYYNYLNDAEDIWYVHHQMQFDPLTYPLDSNYTKETIELIEQNIQYVKSTACPSGLGGGGSLKSYTSPRQNILEADNHIALLTEQLNARIDGGNTEELNFEVMTSLPDEGLEIRQQLLSESPYLSDTVIKQAIYKEDVLPNAMIRDILDANPQSAKSEDVLNTLDSRFEPMPDYMMAQIMQGREYLGVKEFLEADIQSWKHIRAKAKSALIRQFLLDTNMVNPLDSVIAFLETEIDLKSKYDLAFWYWNNLDSANAILTFNNIPFQFILNENQIAIHQQYEVYFDILKMMEDSSWQASDLDSSSVQILFDLMDDGNIAIAAYSRGLLVKGGFFDYIETINIPEYYKSGRPHDESNDKLIEQPKQDYLRVFPNPAGDYVIAYYNIDLKYDFGVIRINDMKGNLVRSYTINSGKNQIVLDLKNIPNGLYIIGLFTKDRLLEVEKISKGRN